MLQTAFYPNGGRSQPGCGWDVVGSCAHGRAYLYYIESINNDNFYAVKCGSFESLVNGVCLVAEDPVTMGGERGNFG